MKPTLPPRYNIDTLAEALQADTPFPDSLPTHVLQNEVINQPDLKWLANPHVMKRDMLALLLGKSHRIIKVRWGFMLFNWAMVVSLITVAVFSGKYGVLWALLIYVVLLLSGPIDVWIAIIVLTAANLLLVSTNTYGPFPLLALIAAWASYIINKINYSLTQNAVVAVAKTDTKTFWQYYKNKIILPSMGVTSSLEFEYIIKRYPAMDLS